MNSTPPESEQDQLFGRLWMLFKACSDVWQMLAEVNKINRKNEGRLPRAAPHLDVSEVSELDFPTCLLQMGLELVWRF